MDYPLLHCRVNLKYTKHCKDVEHIVKSNQPCKIVLGQYSVLSTYIQQINTTNALTTYCDTQTELYYGSTRSSPFPILIKLKCQEKKKKYVTQTRFGNLNNLQNPIQELSWHVQSEDRQCPPFPHFIMYLVSLLCSSLK